MRSTADLVTALKAELKAAGLTYADLARRLGLAESTIKRNFAQGEMTLSRIDAILGALQLDFGELVRRIAEATPVRVELTLEQERAVVSDRRLLLVAICCLSEWTREQIVASYRLTQAECIGYLARLDRLGIIELRARDRYRLRVTKGFRWRADGPVMAYFRDVVVPDYFGGGFDGDEEALLLVHGSIGRDMARSFNDRLLRLAQDYARQHRQDQRLPFSERRPFTLVLGMRSWLFGAFHDLQRVPIDWASEGAAGSAAGPAPGRSHV